MPLSQFRFASRIPVHAAEKGKLYSNVGRIYVARACVYGIDAYLWATLKVLVDELGIALNVNSFCTGKHSPNSRHYARPCLAADCNRVGKTAGNWQPFTVENPDGQRVVDLLLQAGWSVGEGIPTRPGLLLGPPRTRLNPTSIPHDGHLHVSCGRYAPGGPPGAEEIEEPFEDV